MLYLHPLHISCHVDIESIITGSTIMTVMLANIGIGAFTAASGYSFYSKSFHR